MTRKAKLPRAKSPGEELFAAAWRSLGGPEPVREYKFHQEREWRFDFAWQGIAPCSCGRAEVYICPWCSGNACRGCGAHRMVINFAVEIEGGTKGKSRHTSHAGFVADCEKYNAAARLGWRVFRLTTDMVDLPHLREILEVMR